MSWLNKLTGKKEEVLSEEQIASGEFTQEIKEEIQDSDLGTEEKINQGEESQCPGPVTENNLDTVADKNVSELDVIEEEVVENSLKDNEIDSVKKVRVFIDEIIQFGEVAYGTKSNLYNKLFSSKAWLGKLLEQYGTDNPYKTEKPVLYAAHIPATADVSQGMAKIIYDFKNKSEIERINMFRDSLSEAVDKIEALDIKNEFIIDGRLAAIAKTQSYVNACEARFELGYELSVIRNRNK